METRLIDFTFKELDILASAIIYRQVALGMNIAEPMNGDELETLALLRTQIMTAQVEVKIRENIASN
jgi:hypothetical protein